MNPPKTYGEWLALQTPERVLASIRHMEVCRLYGEAQRRAPFSEETETLRLLIRAYNEEYPE